MRIEVPRDEVEAVRTSVAPFVHRDERDVRGSVHLSVVGGRRLWQSGADPWSVWLRGGEQDGEVDINLPARLLFAGEAGALVLDLAPLTEDGYFRQPAVLRVGEVALEFWPHPAPYPVDADAPVTPAAGVVRVSRGALTSALEFVRRAPFRLEQEDLGWPATAVTAAGGQLELMVRWPQVGPTTATIEADGEGAGTASVEAEALLHLLTGLEGDVAKLSLPATAREPLFVSDDTGTWTAALRQLPHDVDLLPVRRRLEALLREGFGITELTRDDDGDYPFAVADTAMYVRLARRTEGAPAVQVFATLVDDVKSGPEVLEELNAINVAAHLVRVFWVRNQVLAEAELIASDLDLSELTAACDAVAGAVRSYREVLHARFAGAIDAPVPWDAFTETLVHVRGPSGWAVFQPTDEPPGADAWPFPGVNDIWVITAFNPGGVQRANDENTRARQILAMEAVDAGWTIHEAVGVAADRATREPSIAIFDGPRDDILALAHRYQQTAAFHLTPDTLEVVDCVTGEARTSRGWTLTA